jgi:dethiobiotin synthetase
MAFLLKYGKSLEYSYIKPFQSGDMEENDTDRIKQITSGTLKIEDPFYAFTYPASPYYASILEKKTIKIKKVESYLKENNNKKILVEGAGGVLVPITEKKLYIDILKNSKIPVIIVCKTGLGTVNHTLLTIEALRKRKIEILGFYGFGKRDTLGMDNMIYIERYTGEKFLGAMDLPEFFEIDYLKEFFTDHFKLGDDFLNLIK